MARALPTASPRHPSGLVLGRYALYDEIAAGGMAVVHFGRLLGPVGFARTVAIKRLHPHYARDPEFVSMFLDEARLAARIRHPNVVPTIDVVTLDSEVFLVMEYVQGETLSRLARVLAGRNERMPVPVSLSVLIGVLHGLHAAHEARNERGQPLDIIHRDVSPQNILVGEDGAARIADFGIAKASWRAQSTREGQFKGKLPYMAPEQISHDRLDRRVDIYAAGVVLWEMLVGRRLFDASNPASVIERVLHQPVIAPGRLVSGIPGALDAVTLKALSREENARFATAREMAIALEHAAKVGTAREVGDWVMSTAGETLQRRAAILSAIERTGEPDPQPLAPPDELPTTDEALAGITELPASELRTLETKSTLFSSIRDSPHGFRTGTIAAGSIALGVAAALLFWPRSTRMPQPEPAVDPSTSVGAGSDNPVVIVSAPMPSDSIPGPADGTLTAATTASNSVPAPSAPAPHASPRPAAPRPKAKPDCTPPFTIDSDGVRIPKPGCF